jgi:apolipoprotein N-acyltransferase
VTLTVHPERDKLQLVARFALAILSGGLFAWSFPNVAIRWFIFLAPIPLFVAIARSRRARDAFFAGWISQTVSWLLMAPWVVRVMSHYGGLPYLTGVAIYVAMCLYLGSYGGGFGLIAYRLLQGGAQRGFHRWLLLPLAWSAVEYARTYLFTGFPWNLAAAAIVDYTPLVQIDRFAGPYFLPVLIFLPATLVSWLIVAKPERVHASFASAIVIAICVVWAATGYTAEKIIGRPAPEPALAALLQPNISQEMRWNESNLMSIFDRMMAMSSEASSRGASLIVWPESTVPLSYSSTDFYRGAIEGLSREHSVDIILGSIAEDSGDPTKIWNAAFLVSGGRTVGHYDKIRLVPFGEYVPLRKMLFFANKLVHAVGEFQFGTKDTPLPGRLRYGLAICYEIVFPQIARQQVINGAEVLVTITNDAWYDGTSAPRQHLDQARLRAIETDRYLLRAATTGISAFVDPTGRIVEQMPMNRQGIVYPKFAPRHSVTPYVRFGDWFAWVACFVVVFALLRPLRTSLRNHP